MRRVPDGFVQYSPSPRADGIYPGRDACPHIVLLPTQGCCDPEFYCRESGEMVPVTSDECIRCKEADVGVTTDIPDATADGLIIYGAQSVTSGNTVTVNAFDDEIADAA